MVRLASDAIDRAIEAGRRGGHGRVMLNPDLKHIVVKPPSQADPAAAHQQLARVVGRELERRLH
jgi:aldehyde:ferredoxin oxidoreductase